ncbi:MAG: virulence RhuM family protein [Desulfobacteraceae bacterium]|nr:virulence RhuM family protein [Desulfobacteraceae bacterium]
MAVNYNLKTEEKLDAFLQFNGQEILTNAGSVTKQIADKLAMDKYEKYHRNRLLMESKKDDDFEKTIKELK